MEDPTPGDPGSEPAGVESLGSDATAAGAGLDDVRRLRAAARRDRQEWPFALMVLGVVVLLAWPFYVRRPPRGSISVVRVSQTLGPLADIGPAFSTIGLWAGLYWVVALVVAGLLIAVHYRRAAARRGIAGPLWPVVTAGLVLLVAMLALTPRAVYLVSRTSAAPLSTAALPATAVLWMRGLTPLLVIALVVVALAWTERSGLLAVIAAAFLALALVANLYDPVNLGYRTGLAFAGGPYDLLPNLLIPGGVLLLAGALAAVWQRARR